MTLNYLQIAALMIIPLGIYILINKAIERAANPKNHPRIPSTENALDIITTRGYQAYLWLPGTKHREDQTMFDALEALKHNGYIITDEKGCLSGGVAKARLNSNEKANHLRANFKIIETE